MMSADLLGWSLSSGISLLARTAFAVDMIGDTVTLGSRLECDSFTTATVDASIPATEASWGRLKQLYR